MSRTKKAEYTKSKQFDATCRNHGACPYCRGNRFRARTKVEQAAEAELKTIDQLAEEQGVKPVENIDEFPRTTDDDEGFEEEIDDLRKGG
jgi:hypothetical protein